MGFDIQFLIVFSLTLNQWMAHHESCATVMLGRDRERLIIGHQVKDFQKVS